MTDPKTCRSFAPDRVAAQTLKLVANPRWRFDQLFADSRCTNPAMGAGDMPVPCEFQNNQPACACYVEEPTRIIEVWRHPKPVENFGDHAYEFLLISENRMGPGARFISTQRFPSADAEGEELGEGMPLELFTSPEHGVVEVEQVALTWAEQYRTQTGNNWERVPSLEGRADRPSYFNHVLALTANE